MTSAAPENMSRRQQFVQTYKMARKTDRWLGLWVFLAFLFGAALGGVLFWLFPGDGFLSWVFVVVGALSLGLLAALYLFGRRAQKAAYSQMHGQLGSAAAALSALKRGWKTDSAVGFTKQQDVVHRVVGPPGIVLVGEGNHGRVKTLLANERRKHERVVADTPVHEVICGDGEGEVPLDKLVKHVMKLGKFVKPADMTDILNRLKALDATRPNIPLPKGPVPTSLKGLRGNLRGR